MTEPTTERDDQLAFLCLFIEHLNSECAARVRSWKHGAPAAQTVLSDVRRSLPDNIESFAPDSEFARRMLVNGIRPKIDYAVLDKFVELMLAPARVEYPQPGHLKVVGNTNLSRLHTADILYDHRIYMYPSRSGSSFSTRGFLGDPQISARVTSRFWDEPFRSMELVEHYLIAVCGVKEEWSSHEVQQWIMRMFRIPTTRKFKYALAGLSESLNEMLYGKARPSKADIHSIRSNNVGLPLLLETLESFIAPVHEDSSLVQLNALGLLMLLKARRLVRSLYHWFGTDPLPHTSSLPDILEAAEPRLVVATEPPPPPPEIVDAADFKQCIGPLRPMEYTFLQTMIFGLQPSMSGLNFVFRGGLVPYSDYGRTLVVSGAAGSGKTVFALQMLADIAAMGGVGVYFSFEETYENIVDRLLTFNLLDSSRYDVVEPESGELIPLLHAADRTESRGLLILYGVHRDGEYPLTETIERIGMLTREKWALRALVIDSVNALSFGLSGGHSIQEFRRVVKSLMDAVEQQHFLGILISERHDGDFAVLPYLADTVIEMGLQQDSSIRSLAISKCRTQAFQEGSHPYRISERKGITIYPSLSAIRSALRRRVHATLSKQRYIPLPGEIGSLLDIDRGLAEKSSTLIWGGHGSGKTLLALHLLTQPSHSYRNERDSNGVEIGPPKRVLVVTFKTPEVRFYEALRANKEMSRRWSQMSVTSTVRWYSPGQRLPAEQIIWDLWRTIGRSRREGLPIDRIFFDELEFAEHLIPAVQNEPLFWPTIIELCSTEAITTFFSASVEKAGSRALALLRSHVDYAVHLFMAETDEGVQQCVRMTNVPHLDPFDRDRIAPLHLFSGASV